MSLIYHLGAAGSGKTYSLYNQIIRESMEHPERNYFIIVPEQFTLETQKEIVRLHPRHAIMNIDILSFNRLSYRIFEELGLKQPVTLEDTGKGMIVKKVMLDKKDSLQIYGNKVHQQGIIEEMKSLVSEFLQYNIDYEKLDCMKQLAEGRHRFTAKLNDIETVYRGFREFIEGRYITGEELVVKLSEVADKSLLLKGSVFCFDGFTGFTPSQFVLFDRLVKLAEDIHISLTLDARYVGKKLKEHDFAYLSYKTMERCSKRADEVGMEIKTVVHEGTPYRFRNSSALSTLERNIFRHCPVKAANSTGIRIASLQDVKGEVDWVIARIRQLVAEEGLKYKEIAVVTGSLDSYAFELERGFGEAGIPVFIDRNKNILGQPLVEAVRAVLEAAEYDYTYESVFRFIKCGFLKLSEDEISRLENYCRACGVRGASRWKKEFNGHVRDTRYRVDLEEINGSRSRVADIMLPVTTVLRNGKSSIAERLKALEDMIALLAEQDSTASPEEGEAAPGLLESREYQAVHEVFERIDLLLSEDIITLKEFREILETGFAEAKLRHIPEGNDYIVAGDMERTRLNDIRALFLMGANDTVIPKQNAGGSILSEHERSILADHEIELSPTKRQNAYMNEFYLYLFLTKPSERLFLSYRRQDSSCKPMRPSYLVDRIRTLYTGLEVENLTSKEIAEDPYGILGRDGGVSFSAALLRDKEVQELSANERELLRLLSREDPEVLEKLVEAAFYRNSEQKISSETAEQLYGRVLKGSVTRLEKYASCAFSHFISFGLKLEERQEYAIRSLDIGNIYHKALQIYSDTLKEKGISWHEAAREDRLLISETSLSAAMAEYNERFDETARTRHIAELAKHMLDTTVEAVTRQIAAGDFEPEMIEKNFMYANDFMQLSGKIDRLDICRRNDRLYLRVIDYKTGNKSFDLNELYYGLQIQLAVYMDQAERLFAGQNPEPAGMYYYDIREDLIDKGKDVEEKLKKSQRMIGPSSLEGTALHATDNAIADEKGILQPGIRSNVAKLETSKNAVLTDRAKVLAPSQFAQLTAFVAEGMEKRGREILSGNTEVDPYRLGKKTGCDYCAYRSVCCFDRKLGSSYREISKLSEEDIWLNVSGQTDNGQ